MERLRALLAVDVTLYADGGGKVPARRAPVAELDNVMRLFAAFASVFAVSRPRLLRYGFINGLPGFITIERGDILQTTALEIEDGRVVAVYVVRNPDKLRHPVDLAGQGIHPGEVGPVALHEGDQQRPVAVPDARLDAAQHLVVVQQAHVLDVDVVDLALDTH